MLPNILLIYFLFHCFCRYFWLSTNRWKVKFTWAKNCRLNYLDRLFAASQPVPDDHILRKGLQNPMAWMLTKTSHLNSHMNCE